MRIRIRIKGNLAAADTVVVFVEFAGAYLNKLIMKLPVENSIDLDSGSEKEMETMVTRYRVTKTECNLSSVLKLRLSLTLFHHIRISACKINVGLWMFGVLNTMACTFVITIDR